jgi:hypothetical protein
MIGQMRTPGKRANQKRHGYLLSLNVTYFLLFYLWLLPIACAVAEDPDSPWVLPTHKDYPPIRRSGKRIADFIPRGWTIMGEALGNLQGGLSKDVVLVLKNTKPKFIQTNTSLGVNEIDTNPRMLLILFRDSKTGIYKLAERSDTFIPIPDDPLRSEPFLEVSIRNKILRLKFGVWSSAGSWSCSETSYKFRWQDSKLVLIGADDTDTQRNTGEETAFSYNFLTGKERITTSNFADHTIPQKTQWRTLRVKKLKPLRSFKGPYQWQVEPGRYL